MRPGLIAYFVFGGVSLSFAAEPAVDFNRDIRPILSNKCFTCHGPDEAERQGGTDGLRLDTKAGAFEDLGGYTVIVAGKPDESELIRRVQSTDASEVMPPPETGKRLTAKEIELLKRWIHQGAKYAQHWSYIKPERPALPTVQQKDWPKNEVDHFILARLENEGLKPSPRADHYTLIRRLSLDLTGLPPTLEEVEQFINDKSPNAYEQLVDRLLAKESYGEHWARMWLDLARYADSAGYADDPPRTIWAYRDYVVRSLNANKPFDQFTIEQIAGDLLPNPTKEQLTATAFHRNTLTNNEGGTNDEEFRNVAIVDRVNTTMAVWMGTTMACAQCHSHKYDPITQEEYFRFFAIFNNTEDADRRNESPLLDIYTEQQREQKAAWQTEIAELEKRVKALTPELKAAQEKWEQRLSQPLAWQPTQRTADPKSKQLHLKFDQEANLSAIRLMALPMDNKNQNGNSVVSRISARIVPTATPGTTGRYVRVEIPGDQKILSLAEVQVFAGGKNIAPMGNATQSSTDYDGPAKLAIDGNTDGHFFKAKSTTHTAISTNPWWQLDLNQNTAIERIAIWNRTDGTVGSRLKDFRIAILDENQKPIWEKTVSEAPNPSATWELDGVRQVHFATAIANFTQNGFNAASLITSKPDKNAKGWVVNPKAEQPQHVILLPETPLDVAAGSELVLTMDQKPSEMGNAAMSHFAVQITNDPRAGEMATLPSEAVALLQIPKDKRTAEQQAKLAEHFLATTPLLKADRQHLAKLQKQLAEQKPATTVPIMRELPPNQRRVTKIQQRGNYLITGKEVSAGVPAVFHPLPEEAPKDRLALAHWLIDESNPLTARVIANRYWEKIFGIGLVETSEEFGSQGEPPSHPGLLDWLATELVHSNWNLKRFIKLLVTSATYQQQAAVTPELLEVDPDNRLLTRGPRFRMSAEMIRDQALFVSGLLSEKMYGPPVKPPQPKLGLNAAFGSGIDWQTSQGSDKYRRGLYTMWRRSNPYPSMATFDAPNREVCTLRRDRTNTPLQALVTLNDPVYVEAAQALGRRMADAEGDLQERLAFGFQTCVARPLSAKETQRLEQLYQAALKRYAAAPDLATKMATDPLGPLPEKANPAEYAAWTMVGNVLLNLDEMFMPR